MNAKTEFEAHVMGLFVKCAAIGVEYFETKKLTLKLNHTKQDYEDFLKSLDFEYNNGYGGQELYGTIWYSDGTYSDRGEYDGSEWWEHHKCPEIPAELA